MSKCSFYQNELSYLGYRISNGKKTEFNSDVKYIRGEENTVADSPSRVLNFADVDSEGEMSAVSTKW